MVKSIGVIEVKGIAAAFKILDEMVKAANIEFAGSEKSLGSGLVSTIIKGNVSSVKSALLRGRNIAEQYNARIGEVMLPNPHPELVRLIERKWAGTGVLKRERVSVGSIETFGYAGFVAAADAALKAADVRLARYGTAKGEPGTIGLILILRVCGSVEDVKVAVKAGAEQASKVSEIITCSVNPNLDEQVLQKYIGN